MKPKLFEMPNGETLDLTNLYSLSPVYSKPDGVPIIGQTQGHKYYVKLRFTHHLEGHDVLLSELHNTADYLRTRIVDRWAQD